RQSRSRTDSRRCDCFQEALVRGILIEAGRVEPDGVWTSDEILLEVSTNAYGKIAARFLEPRLDPLFDLAGWVLVSQAPCVRRRQPTARPRCRLRPRRVPSPPARRPDLDREQ